MTTTEKLGLVICIIATPVVNQIEGVILLFIGWTLFLFGDKKEFTCTWTLQDDGTYEIGCSPGQLIDQEAITDNHYKFCPWCGGRIKEEGK